MCEDGNCGRAPSVQSPFHENRYLTIRVIFIGVVGKVNPIGAGPKLAINLNRGRVTPATKTRQFWWLDAR